MKKEIYIIRHGETDFNQLGIVQGRGVDSSLNETGRKQAQHFFDAYKDAGFQKIFVSTLKRTHETIAPFRALGIPIIAHEGLDEISWGIHEGKKDGDTFKDFYRVLHAWQHGETDLAIDDGESPITVQQRQLRFLDELTASGEDRILICSHGRAIRILMCTMLKKPLSEMDTFPHQNTSLYKMIYDGNSFATDLFNDITHLHAT